MSSTTRREFLKYAAASTGIASALCFRSGLGDESNSTWLRGIDDYVETALAKWKLPGLAIGVVRDGEVVHCRGYGVRAAGGRVKVDDETVFPLASCTKPFIAAAIAKLVDSAKVAWDDPIAKHLPRFQLATPELTSSVTIRHALSHRTGLPTANMLWRRGDFGSDEIIERLRHLQPVAAPGKRHIYNNNMYLVLGKLLEHISGQSWSDFLRREILQPLGMASTVIDSSVISQLENIAAPHAADDGDVKPAERYIPIAIAPAGAIHSCVRDMTRWLRFQLSDGRFEDHEVLSKARMTEMHSAPKQGPEVLPAEDGEPRFPLNLCGLSWFFSKHAGQRIIEHAGTQAGFVSWMAMMPAKRLGVVVFGNCHRTGLVPAMKSWIFDAALDEPRRDWSEETRTGYANGYQRLLREAKANFESQRDRTTRPAVALAQYAGTYRSELYGDLRVLIEDDQLSVRFGTRFDGRLTHWQRDAFRATFASPRLDDWLITFAVQDGQVTSLRVKEAPWVPTWYDDSDDLGEFVCV